MLKFLGQRAEADRGSLAANGERRLGECLVGHLMVRDQWGVGLRFSLTVPGLAEAMRLGRSGWETRPTSRL
ncbi:hypothetical protein NS226_23255 [Aureimonas ureilytica]|uniref:Uncharacterized protein n=1 Tax=Aureimonas ureilytica TaxID=401562 RepID=A0A175QPV5_9HYPH|nr:hypothetical protein NS226_23255 [Aureimonas ureilytica]